MSNQEVVGGVAAKMFSLGKWLSLVFAILALLAVIFVAIELLTLGSSFKTPSFDAQARQAMIGSLTTQQSNVAQQKEQLKLSRDYGSRVISIISKYGIQDVKMNQIIHLLLQMPPEYRHDFISGWSDYVRDGIDYAKKNGVYQAQNTSIANSFLGASVSEGTADILTQQYINEFSNAIAASKTKKREDHFRRLSLFAFIVSAVIVFILAMVLPVLVQIEKNTRSLFQLGVAVPTGATPVTKTSAFAETPQVPEKLCPKCHAPVTEDDVFCGNCGAALR